MPQATKRWLVRIVVAAALLFGIPLLANLYGFYGTTDFEDYVRTHPVSDETLASRLPEGSVALTDDGSLWKLGSVDPFAVAEGASPDGRSTWTGRTRIRVVRGDTELAHAQVEARVTAPDGKIRDGFALRVTGLRSAENLRAVVVARVDDRDRLIGPEAVARGHVSVELLLLAGDGPDQALLQAGGQEVHLPHDTMGLGSMLGMWLQLLFPVLPPPAEGFWLHLRSGFGFSGEQRESSRSGGSLDLSSFDASTELYSFDATIESAIYDDPDNKFTSEGSVSVSREFFGSTK